MFRSDIWVAAFVRRHNDIGHICVVARRGDPIAGQIFVEVDHLNGETSLYVPAPAASRADNPEERLFQRRFDRVGPDRVRQRLVQEEAFDPDFWVISLELRSGDLGLLVVA
ncbi:DUF1491 family protein [Devosia sp.]|uniref:DUF1491 family protein n=1 Tax=Devosia sp. TaxID=1871048 RepID=UPI0035B03487